MKRANSFHIGWGLLGLLGLICTCHAAGKADASADTWPRFRGQNGSGIGVANLPSEWTQKDYNWNVKLPGGGNSSPVVWKDRIFLTCGDDKTGEHSVICINAADGSIRWKKSYPAATYKHHPFNSYASSSPALDEKHVFVCWSTPEEFTLLALDHDGKELWKKDLGPFISQHGGGQSPIAYDGMVIVGDDQEGPESFVFALNGDTGAQIWKTERKPSNKFSPATPCVFQPKFGFPQLIVMNKSQGFTALDPRSGHEIWEVKPKDYDARPVASPYVADGLIFCSCGDGPQGHNFAAVRPSPDGQSADIAYDFRKASPYVPTSIVVNDLLFYVTDNGIMACLKVKTGAQVWRQRLDSNFFGSFVCADDKLYILSKEGEMYVIAAKDKYELLGKMELKLEDEGMTQPPLSTTPAIANGVMYIRTYTHLVSLGHAK